MTLDVWMAARLADELHEMLAGSRVQALLCAPGQLDLSCRRRGGTIVLSAALDSQAPLCAALPADGAADDRSSGGWAGSVAPLLRGSIVESVHAAPNDRIIFVDLRSRSAFGVPARHRVVLELEPMKPNALIVRPLEDRSWQILAAHRVVEGKGDARSIVLGEGYEMPPPRTRRRDRASFDAAIAAAQAENAGARTLARLVAEFDIRCTQPLARETVARTLAAGSTARSLSDRLVDSWKGVLEELQAAAGEPRSPVYVYRSEADVVACHIVRLTWPGMEPATVPTCNEAAIEALRRSRRRAFDPAAGALRKRIATLLARCEQEMSGLRRGLASARDADALRIAGDTIYAYVASIPERAERFVTPDGTQVTLDPERSAKENAAEYFRRFKKARKGLPRIEQRLAVLERQREYWEQLAWELDRALEGLVDVLAALVAEITAALGPAKAPGRAAKPRALPSTRVVDLGGGAVAHVGRSPKDNERVTFTVAAPDDFWFHARNVPGAHVVLKTPSGVAPDQAQIIAAASLAAGQSKAADATAVEVDYTQRKHVRRQGGGRVGLVWYTDFKTVRVSPKVM